MIKAIIFDLGGVVFTNGAKKFIETLANRYGIAQEKIKEVLDGEIGSKYRTGKMPREQFWKTFLHELNINADFEALELEWINGYELIEGTIELIDTLSKRYKIYFLSDNTKERVKRLDKKYNFLSWFADGVFSHQVGYRKPHPKIYEAVVKKAQVKPNEAVFIDDKPHFLPPAKAMGMLTFAFETPKKLREDLEKYHVL